MYWTGGINIQSKFDKNSADNPRAQSGNGGDEFHYFYTHLPIIEAIHKNGTFCDFGCANGHLLEMVHKWAIGIGYELQMFGVDISQGLIEFAQKRLPQWRDNFFVGNAYHCKPPQKFDYFHMRTLGFPKKENKHAVFNHLMENYLVDDGRMIIGPYWYEDEDSYHDQLLEWGIPPTGYITKTDYRKSNRLRKAMWIDKISIK